MSPLKRVASSNMPDMSVTRERSGVSVATYTHGKSSWQNHPRHTAAGMQHLQVFAIWRLAGLRRPGIAIMWV